MQLTSPFKGIEKIRVYRDARFAVGAAMIINALQWIVVALKVKSSSLPIALHYTTTFGIDRIGYWYLAYLLPASGTGILLMNMLLSSLTAEHQRVSSSLILYLSLLMQGMILASTILTFWIL